MGNPGLLLLDEPAAMQIDTWKEWIIHTKVFTNQSVNFADVYNISIGLGDRDNTQPGGSGKMFFDDIRLYGLRAAGGE